ncbi:hypothetical protein [Rhizobium sp. Leaf383]|uniref:hypothetical protein n=1 Tax=Rhizobium sp. Leaf383 TaxID=1736357 RepID=UPI000712AD2C|nr:hypothetical protein [Rhizobium sp. Leaf383]KQS84335.1 hypothetical protein ASG58_21430 [Rhizobium sp. Leaf383]
MSTILINTGRRVDPFNLMDYSFTAEELLKPLAKLCRYTGHTSRFYSVAEHTVHLINAVPMHLKRAVALHDLNEGLTNDLPRPFKQRLPDYVAFENSVQQHIFRLFDEPWENMAAIAEYDYRICADEMAQLFDEPYILPDAEPLGVHIIGWEWQVAETKLRNSFKFLGLL